MANNMEELTQKADNGVSRVSMRDSKIVIPFILAISLFAVTGRIFLKLRIQRRLDVDDYFLLFGTVCFITATGLYFSMMGGLYVSLLLGTEPSLITLLSADEQMALFTRQLEMHAAFHFLVSTSIFTVKIGFLHFIGKVAQTSRRLYAFWKVAVLITVVFSLYFMVIPFIACPLFGPKAVLQCQGPKVEWKINFLSYLGFATDCFTDLLICAIPILLLRHARAELRQKITVAIFLCLSSFMIFVAIVRVSTMHTKGVFDYTWTNLWLYLEAGVAIIMVSLSAFRTQFCLRREERQRREIMRKPPTENRPSKKQAPWLESEVEGLPTIPQAAMTGMGSFIRGSRTNASSKDQGEESRLFPIATKLSQKEKKNPGLSITVERPDSVYDERSDSDPFITSPSWIKTSHTPSLSYSETK